jgi:thioredoxin 2
MPIVTCPNCGAKNRIDGRAAHLQPVCGRCGAKLHVGHGGSEGAAGHSSTPLTITDASFADIVLGSGRTPVLLDCWAPWCGPCRMIAPTIDQLAAEADGRYLVVKLNVDENPGVAQQYHIDSIPALLIFRDGKVVDQVVGLQRKEMIAQRLMSYL